MSTTIFPSNLSGFTSVFLLGIAEVANRIESYARSKYFLPQDTTFMRIDEDTIDAFMPQGLISMCWTQWRAERALAKRGIRFRTTNESDAKSAYAAMTDEEFAAINGRQAWANWRTIPRCLNGTVPDQPITVVDLGCGTGPSTQVLAHYCPPGSRILGYELAAPLVDIARTRTYRHRDGDLVDVQFVCQPVTETLRGPDGEPLPAHSVDVVNASGVVGHHLTVDMLASLAAELRRVLTADGIAMLDIGPKLRAPVLVNTMTREGFGVLSHHRSCFLDPTGEIVFQVRGSSKRRRVADA